MPDRIRRLLDYIVAEYAVRDEQKDIDLSAKADESGAAIAADKEGVARRESERADELAGAFREGLLLADRARQSGRSEIALDDRDPTQDRIADALIQFLVSFDLAGSRSEETEPRHYVYHVAVDWARLGEVAQAAGVDLDQALR